MKRTFMTAMRMVLIICMTLTVALADKVSAQSPGKGPKSEVNPGRVPMGQYTSWLKSLGPQYNVVQGSVFLMTNDECPEFVAIFNSCFGQNPASPYIIPQPPIDASYVDPYYATGLNTKGPHNQTTNIIYRLGDQDALVTIISYPPRAAYLGYVSYVFTREASDYAGIPPPAPPLTRQPSPDPARLEIFGSIGNGLNNVTVQNQLGVAPWGNAIVAYITTPNENLAAALTASAKKHGIDSKSIFVEPVGANVITGNDSTADDMITLMRYAVAESATAADDWTTSLNKNVLVYKVSNSTVPVQRYGEITYTPHTVNVSETAYAPSLSTAQQQLATLLQNYLATKQSSEAAYQPLVPTTHVDSNGVPEGGLVGASCIQTGTNCEGDSQDTSTYAYLPLTFLGLQQTAFVVGVNHSVAALNNSRYVSVAVYEGDSQSGVASASQTNPQAAGFNSGNLTGSAQGTLQALEIAIPPQYTELLANLPALYVTAVARNINNPTIKAANQYTINLEGISLVPELAFLILTERSYILPGSTAGGNVDQMIYPLVVAAKENFEQSQ
jgi:hypothetical protein